MDFSALIVMPMILSISGRRRAAKALEIRRLRGPRTRGGTRERAETCSLDVYDSREVEASEDES